MTSFVVSKVIGGGVLKLERVQVTCPACGQQVEAVAADGRVKGYCAVAEQYVDFPEMTIIAGWGGGGGWPWVPEMIGVALRHQNVYINTSAHRPKYLATPGSGWEMLMQFGNILLQDRIVFASGWANYLPYSEGVIKNVIQEMRALPLKEEVKEKWLYHNAARLFHRD